eukprot:1417378-Pyramimonas_sp.AAC.1
MPLAAGVPLHLQQPRVQGGVARPEGLRVLVADVRDVDRLARQRQHPAVDQDHLRAVEHHH